MPDQQNDSTHYEECPQRDNPQARCHCDGIRQADDNYWTEQP